MDGAAIVLVVY